MQEENIYIYGNNRFNTTQPSTPPGFDKCHGHNTAMQSSNNQGHYTGDSCDCDGLVPTVSIDMHIPILISIAIALVIIHTHTNL